MNARYATTSLALVLAGYAAGAGAVEPSALLRQPQGRVFVGQTTAMQPARPGMPLYAGDRVVAVSGGRADVVYPDGCAVAVPEGSLLAVKGPEQCRMGQARIRVVEGFQNPRIGQAGPLPSGGSGEAGNDGWVARLERPQGKTFVDEKGAVVPAAPNMGVQNDNRIITEASSRVTVVFRGCEVEVGEGEQATVEELRSRCKDGVLDNRRSGKPLVAGLKQPQGNVTVGRGTETVPAKSNMGVSGGDRIITSPGSRVTVVFDGCRVDVEEREQVLVSELITGCTGGFWMSGGGIAVPALITVAIGAAIAASREDQPASAAAPQ